MGRFHGWAVAGAAVAALVGGGLAAMTTASAADYGSGAQYQITISANTLPAPQMAPSPAGGLWLWIELDGTSSTSGGSGEYQGADCGRGPGLGGAAHDFGSVTWSVTGSTITITGVALNGFGGRPITITVPSTPGHLAESFSSLLSAPLSYAPGTAQVTVAP